MLANKQHLTSLYNIEIYTKKQSRKKNILIGLCTVGLIGFFILKSYGIC